MPIGLSPVENYARVASFNNSESQLEITKASNQQDLDLSDDKDILIQADCLEQVQVNPNKISQILQKFV
jgi:hypothetical protein